MRFEESVPSGSATDGLTTFRDTKNISAMNTISPSATSTETTSTSSPTPAAQPSGDYEITFEQSREWAEGARRALQVRLAREAAEAAAKSAAKAAKSAKSRK
jgi:hypothetical protein